MAQLLDSLSGFMIRNLARAMWVLLIAPNRCPEEIQRRENHARDLSERNLAR